ncbi:cupin domain-containing protein [Brunnivagina elsteri]|uniref:Cupin n=1 Tax=Brunnivagina elsteri CCALA 953 TaxID=987040 RepID=A0A2A2TN26_9CYAN|nr:hypothetical protein [Calothrix elsteri]PAX59754.1 hypothetical protein CK510_05630 [Calothrix elsteri CCALA 953]
MLRTLFNKYLESRPCLTAFNDSENKQPRQNTHFILFPGNRWFNITLNQIMARPEWYKGVLHNHPWFNISLILKGGYWEKTEKEVKWYKPGSIIVRSANKYHSIWIEDSQDAWTLFLHGPIKKGFDFMQDGETVTVEQLGMKPAKYIR